MIVLTVATIATAMMGRTTRGRIATRQAWQYLGLTPPPTHNSAGTIA
ncbi:hypothetical protein ACWELP_10150 [Rhodococcus aetherivorans]